MPEPVQEGNYLPQERVDLVERVLRFHPEAESHVRLVIYAAEHAQFPLKNLDDLGEALGGLDTLITYTGGQFQAFQRGDLNQFIPQSLFPIDSPEALADLLFRIRFLPDRNVGREGFNPEGSAR